MIVLEALDALGLALVAHEHEWSVEERTLYEAAVEELENKEAK